MTTAEMSAKLDKLLDGEEYCVVWRNSGDPEVLRVVKWPNGCELLGLLEVLKAHIAEELYMMDKAEEVTT